MSEMTFFHNSIIFRLFFFQLRFSCTFHWQVKHCSHEDPMASEWHAWLLRTGWILRVKLWNYQWLSVGMVEKTREVHHICIHLRSFASIRINLHGCIHLHTFTFRTLTLHLHIHLYTFIYIYIHLYTLICIHLHPFAYIYKNFHTFTSIYIL